MPTIDSPLYSDLDLNFNPHPLTGDLVPGVNVDAIKRSVRNALSLMSFDIPFDPTKQSHIKRHLFDQATQLTEAAIYKAIEWCLKTMEPRIQIISIDVQRSVSFNGYNITITYEIKSLMIEDTLTFYAQRVR